MSSLSIRTRLTLRWALSFGLLLALTNALIYGGSRYYLHRDLEAYLRTLAATELGSVIDAYRGLHLHGFPDSTLVQREYADKFVQLLADSGHVLAQSDLLRDSPALVSPDMIRQALTGEAPLFPTVVAGRPGLMIALRTDKEGETYLVIVGLFTDRLDASLAKLGQLLVAVWVAAMVLTAGLGFWLAGRALAPIDRITRRAAGIAHGDFAARLDPPQLDDEIGRMTRLLNEMLDRLHGALEANQTFAADAAHELRSPLTAIRGELDVALARTRSESEYRHTLQLVLEQVEQVTALIDSLTLLVHAHEGRNSIKASEVPLLPLLRDSARRVANMADARRITVRFEEFPDIVAYADARLLARVFDNLLRNAVQYNRDDGEVVLHGRQVVAESAAPPQIVVAIRDSGIGIQPDDRERVFERFYRTDRSRSRRTGGTGLGLAIAREVVILFGGTIRVASSSSEGTTFEVTLPGDLQSSTIVTAPLTQ